MPEKQVKAYEVALTYIDLPFVTFKKFVIVKFYVITTKKEYAM